MVVCGFISVPLRWLRRRIAAPLPGWFRDPCDPLHVRRRGASLAAVMQRREWHLLYHSIASAPPAAGCPGAGSGDLVGHRGGGRVARACASKLICVVSLLPATPKE